MTEQQAHPGSSDNPLRVAIIGAGPAGFYAAEHLLKTADLDVRVDLFDMLPTPYGLVRAGVAPDHAKIKNVTAKYDKTAERSGFRFFGNVEIGKDVTVEELRKHYHQIVYTTGAQVDRSLGIPGEDLEGSHSATEFVAWYNGHPDYVDREFDLSQTAAAVVGIGNVAVDVARILARPVSDLESTDMADYALEALRKSNVKTVYVLGRRGPAQAAFTNPEAKELGELTDVDIIVSGSEAELDPISKQELTDNPDRLTEKKVGLIQGFVDKELENKERSIHLRFLVSPTEIIEENGRVAAIKIVRNKLVKDDTGRVRPRPTTDTETLPVGLVFRSVGYRGTPVPDVPFNDGWGIISNEDGRVVDDTTIVVGEYAAGWIKRGPSGVIGTNKACAQSTAKIMLEDLSDGKYIHPEIGDPDHINRLLSERGVDTFGWSDWQELDKRETEAGSASGRPRVKFTTRDEMVAVLKQA